MSKRKRTRVPKVLHTELTEYSSLIRALRTSDTQDLTRQLVKHATWRRRGDNDDLEPESQDEEDLNLNIPDGRGSLTHENLSESPSEVLPRKTLSVESLEPEPKSPAKQDSQFKLKPIEVADLWTRWPLLVGDVNLPEWTFEEEIQAIVSSHLRLQVPHRESSIQNRSQIQEEEFVNDDPQDSETQPHTSPSTVAYETKHYLSRVLTLMEHHIPPMASSLRNRLRPMDWQSVLECVAADGHLSLETLNTVKTRLEEIYGPTESTAPLRLGICQSAKERLEEAYASINHDPLEFRGPPVDVSKIENRTKRKRARNLEAAHYPR